MPRNVSPGKKHFPGTGISLAPSVVSPCPSDLDRGQDKIYPRHFTWLWKLKYFCRNWRCSRSAVQQGSLAWLL